MCYYYKKSSFTGKEFAKSKLGNRKFSHHGSSIAAHGHTELLHFPRELLTQSYRRSIAENK